MPKNNWVNKAAAPVVTDSMADPDTRYGAARHESGHAVVGESIYPGSVHAAAIGKGGGATVWDPPKQEMSQLTPEDLQNMTAISLAGGLSEPGGTTPTHSSGDMNARNRITGTLASSPISNIRRILTGSAGSNDPMLQAPQVQAAGQAKANLVLSDPHKQQQIDEMAGHLNSQGRLYGDEIRKGVSP